MVPDFEQQAEQIRTVGPNLPDLLQASRVERGALVGVLDALGPDDWVRATPCPGWTVHDLVLHPRWLIAYRWPMPALPCPRAPPCAWP